MGFDDSKETSKNELSFILELSTGKIEFKAKNEIKTIIKIEIIEIDIIPFTRNISITTF